MIIWISGPTGSGKSTLAGLMDGAGYPVIREELPRDLFQAFRRDPARHCASLQEAIILSRATQWRIAAGRKNVVFDRGVDEDINIFCRMHHERGLLDFSAYARLRFLADNIIAEMPKPDLVIYLSPRLDVLTTRVVDAGHPQLIADNLQRQVALYEEWFPQSRRDNNQNRQFGMRPENAREPIRTGRGAPHLTTVTYPDKRASIPFNPLKRTRSTLMKRQRAERPLLVIDGDSFAHRAYHGLPKSIRRAGGKGAGAIVGFANYLMRLYQDEQPSSVVVGWDTLEAPNWRILEFAAYQGGRKFDGELLEQLDVLPVFVHACGFGVGKAAGYEADDFLAAAVAVGEKRGWTTLVASGDRDTFQLASELTKILYPVKAGEIARIGPDEVRERYGVGPHQVPDFIALRGDPSDKIPGARGIGAQTAAKLLRRYANLEEMIASGRFQRQAEELRLYRRIATMDATAPLPRIVDRKPTWDIAAALAREWELNDLAERLARMGV